MKIGVYCFSSGDRELGTLELFCHSCENWFHGRCLKQLKNFYALPFMVCYQFYCSKCGQGRSESWVPRQANFAHMCVTALANMTWQAKDKQTQFSLQKEIIPFFNKNWENLTSMPRRVKQTWHQTLQRAMLERTDVFTNSTASERDDQYFGLVESELAKIGPNHDVVKTLGKKQPDRASTSQEIPEPEGPKTRGAKRKAESQANTGNNKKTKNTNDYTSTKFSGYAVPVDHPFNRDGYRYWLVEPDVHAPNRKEFEELEETAGKPIPAYMYRIVHPSIVELSSHDRAPQLKMGDDHLTVTGEKGYSVIRGSHGVSTGSWYFEVTFLEQPSGSHVRLGWSQALGCVQAPVGYDKFSYCWRSRKGTVFHQSMGKHYSEGFGVGDTLGCYIHLPEPSREERDLHRYLPESKKQLPLIKFKSHFYYEEKDEVQKTVKALRPLKGSRIIFYRNGEPQGVAFSDIFSGVYFPAISLYKNAVVRTNFGPAFRYPVKDLECNAMCDRAEQLLVEQTLADILFFVEHEGELTID